MREARAELRFAPVLSGRIREVKSRDKSLPWISNSCYPLCLNGDVACELSVSDFDKHIGDLIAWFAPEGPLRDAVLVIYSLCFAIVLVAYRYYLGLLAQGAAPEGSEERQDYDKLRVSLKGGNLAARLYAKWLTAFLDGVERFFGDAGMVDRTLLPRAFGLKTPASLWTAPAFDRCLLLALIYPIVTIFLIWAVSGQVGPAEAALGLKRNVPGFSRGFGLVAIGILSFAIWRGWLTTGWKRLVWWIGAYAGASVFVFAAVAGAVAIAFAVVGALFMSVAIVFAFFNALIAAVFAIGRARFDHSFKSLADVSAALNHDVPIVLFGGTGAGARTVTLVGAALVSRWRPGHWRRRFRFPCRSRSHCRVALRTDHDIQARMAKSLPTKVARSFPCALSPSDDRGLPCRGGIIVTSEELGGRRPFAVFPRPAHTAQRAFRLGLAWPDAGAAAARAGTWRMVPLFSGAR